MTVTALPLTVGAIDIGADALIFAKTFIAPGVVIGEGAVIGAASVVTRDMPEWTICVGNPCKPMKPLFWSMSTISAGVSKGVSLIVVSSLTA